MIRTWTTALCAAGAMAFAGQAAATPYVLTDLGTSVGSRLNNAAVFAPYGINEAGHLAGFDVPGGGAYGINNLDQSVGGYIFPGESSAHAAMWTGGIVSDLGALAGDISFAWDINDLGVAAGYSYSDAVSISQKATYFADGLVFELPSLGGYISSVFEINNSGLMAGQSAYDGFEVRGAVWQTGSNTLVELGTFGGDFSSAWGLNELGVVVGSASLANETQHGFIWTGGAIQDLTYLVDLEPGSYISGAFDINDRGQILASLQTLTGRRAVLLTPTDYLAAPEPGTWLLMILGFGAIGLRLRRQAWPRPREDKSGLLASASAVRAGD